MNIKENFIMAYETDSQKLSLRSYGPQWYSTDLSGNTSLSLGLDMSCVVRGDKGENKYDNFCKISITEQKSKGEWDRNGAVYISLMPRSAYNAGDIIEQMIEAQRKGVPFSKGIPSGSQIIEFTNGGKLGIPEGRMSVVIYFNLDENKYPEKYNIFPFNIMPVIDNYTIEGKKVKFTCEQSYADIEYLAKTLKEFGVRFSGAPEAFHKRASYFALRPTTDRMLSMLDHLGVVDPVSENRKPSGGYKPYSDWTNSQPTDSGTVTKPSTSDDLANAIDGISDDEKPF